MWNKMGFKKNCKRTSVCRSWSRHPYELIKALDPVDKTGHKQNKAGYTSNAISGQGQ